jgi:hypothetical protein
LKPVLDGWQRLASRWPRVAAVRTSSPLLCGAKVLVDEESLSTGRASPPAVKASFLVGGASRPVGIASLLEENASFLEEEASLLEENASFLEDRASLLVGEVSLRTEHVSVAFARAAVAIRRARRVEVGVALHQERAAPARGDDSK